MRTTKIAALAALVLAGLTCSVLAANTLVNPSFEDPPYGYFPTEDPDPAKQYAPTGWLNPGTQAWQQWQGVFDSTWYNPPCDPNWPQPVHQPVDGSYFLGHWFPPQSTQYCEYDNVHMGGRSSYIYQTVTGLTPGATYYLSAYFATQHPHGWGMFRMVCLPQTYDPGTQTFDPPLHEIYPIYTPLEEGGYLRRFAFPAETESSVWPYFTAHFTGSDEAWKKLTGEVTLSETQNAATIFVAYLMSSNNLAEPQYVQVDKVRFADTQELEIKNIEITNYTTNTVTIEWDVTDGDAMVYGLGSATYVKYGATSAYGSTAAATEIDPAPNPANDVWCDSDRHPSPGHYAATITGLTQGNTYHFAVAVNAGTHNWVGGYNCPGPPSNPNPAKGSRDYDAAQSEDATFQMLPLLTLSNITATGITATSATITWTSNAAADSKVSYGMFGVIDSQKYDAAMVTNHSVTLTDLSPNTSYTYKVTSAAPGYNPTTSAAKTFTTALGPDIMNGSFEFRAKSGQAPRYWTDCPARGSGLTYPNGEWSVPSQQGQWYFGSISNASGSFNNVGRYQQIATTPGEVISFYCWSYATGQAAGSACDVGEIHRFGENNNQLAIDPEGTNIGPFTPWMSEMRYGGQLGSMRFNLYWPGNHCGNYGQYRRLGTCAIAQSTKANLYLWMRGWYANGWVMNFFDNAHLAPLTEVHSVGELKSLISDGIQFQTNVILTEPAEGGYVVTYVVNPNNDTWENNQQPYFYIEDLNRAAGIKVTLGDDITWPEWLAVGKKVNVIGTTDWATFFNYTHGKNYAQQLRMDNPCGEPTLRAIKIEDAGSGTVPGPVGVTNLSLGGGSSSDPWYSNAGVAGGYGANNIGLRVRTWGKIVDIGYEDDGRVYLVIDDGSALPPPDPSKPKPSLVNQTQPGLYVRTMGDPYNWPMLEDNSRAVEVGDYVILTGISGVRLDLDWTDLNGVPDPNDPGTIIPEAMKNMRAIKIEAARYFALPE